MSASSLARSACYSRNQSLPLRGSQSPITDRVGDYVIATAIGNDRCPAATVSIKDKAVVDDLRLRQTRCILHHMQGIRADRCCRVNAPVGGLGPCSDANHDQSRYENADLTHLNSPVVGLTAYPVTQPT